MSKLICPFMSCRVTSVADPSSGTQTLTPTIITCQEEQCAVWDSGNKVCGVLSLSMELIKHGENNQRP